MRKTLFLLLICAIALPSAVFAQGLAQKGLIAGLNLATLSGDDKDMDGISPDSKMGFAAGGFLVFNFTDAVGIRPEVLYSQRGAKYESEGYEVKVKLDYIEIPILLQYTVPMEGSVSPIILVGPTLGIKMSAEVETPDGDMELDDYVKGTDFGIQFGAGVLINNMIEISGRYYMGLSTIDDGLAGMDGATEELDIKNSAIEFRAAISL